MRNEFKHYGIKRRSGRYPWGSGGDEYQRSSDFYAYVDALKGKGIPDKEIAKAIGLEVKRATGDPNAGYSVADLRTTRTVAKEVIVQEETQRAVALRNKGVSVKEIAEQLDMAQPTVRLRLKNSENMKKSMLNNTADVIRADVDKFDIVDIGLGTEYHVLDGISPERLKAATSILQDEGYEVYNLKVRNPGTMNLTNTRVIVKPGTGYGETRRMQDRIHTMGKWTEDDGKTFLGIHTPMNVDPKRIQVRYKEDGGDLEDGLIYVRPGVKDLSMGKNTYAQVRIAVDGTHYMKGMAILKDDMPPGVDLVYNTPKSKTDPKVIKGGKKGVMKELAIDPSTGQVDKDNPFGAIIKRQIVGVDKDGKEVVTSALNILNETGDWDGWRKSLPSQMLAKQPHSLIKSQLKVTRDEADAKLAEIESITNPIIRKKRLEDYADQIDADAVDLRAAQMPKQRTQVLIPVPSIKKDQVYAPNFETGTPLVLIRYPHGGRFEIPEVTVNNNNRKAKQLLGNATDAIGIHPAVAERLSGADFDGDTVVAIPNRQGKIKGSQSMGSQAKIYEQGLKDFDPKRTYGGFESQGVDKNGKEFGNFPLMQNTGLEMGKITNLITDMSVQGAKPEHVVRAVRHSMVVIDAEKHKLNYKASEQFNNIAQLKELYQRKPGSKKAGGASTLLSQATAKDRLPERKLRSMADGGPIDEKTGKPVWVESGKTRSKYDAKTKTYLDEKVPVLKDYKRLELADDAYDLVRDKADPVERLYADHANEMKARANKARLRAYKIPTPRVNPAAKKEYAPDIKALVDDLNKAKAQKPLDRRANNIANVTVKMKREQDPLLRDDPDRLKRVERQAKDAARQRLGLEKPVIEITDRQWDAIQAGGVSANILQQVLKYADPERVSTLAMPRQNTVMTSAITARAKAMLRAGATNGEIAAALGISVSTLRAAAIRGDV